MKFKRIDMGRDGQIVEIATGRVVMTLEIAKWDATLNFEVKLRNGEIVPRWIDGTLIFVPAGA